MICSFSEINVPFTHQIKNKAVNYFAIRSNHAWSMIRAFEVAVSAVFILKYEVFIYN